MTENAVSVFKTMRFSLDATPCLQISSTLSFYFNLGKIVYMYSTKRDCCNEHYSWNLECMGESMGTTGNKYYPDWTGDDICKNDGEGPTYMALNPTMWLHDTLAECCKSTSLAVR